MRRIALVALLAATGCNWVFGLEPTVITDGAISELPPGPRTKLVWGIATTNGSPAAPAIDSEVVYQPIGSEAMQSQAPSVQVGDDNALAEATYRVEDGSFEIPYALRESPHRIVYTLPGESVPHEVQWALTGAFLVVPRTTRADAPAIPPASGYRIAPTGLTGTLLAPAIYTSGVFTFDDVPAHFTQTSGVSYAFAQHAAPLTTPGGAPQTSQGDWVLLAEFASRGGGLASVDGWALTNIDLVANTISTPTAQPAWKTTKVTLSGGSCPASTCLPQSNASQLHLRLDAVVGTAGTDSVYFAYGVSPSADLPGFLPGVAPTFVERPLILPFAESSNADSVVLIADPSPELALSRVVMTRFATSRTVNGAVLTSTIQSITNLFVAMMPFPAPLATNITLGTTSLSGATDAVPFAASSSVQRLKFETEATYSADDFVITLYEISNGTLTPVRVYHVLQPDVKIDGSLLVAGRHYVFGINARTGFGSADRGDYAKAQYPFGSSTTFARTFVVQ
jgi:hypothetical protein